MADTKVHNLSHQTPVSTDELYLVQVSGPTSKKCLADDILALGGVEYLGTVALSGATTEITTIGSSTHKAVLLYVVNAVVDTNNVSAAFKVKTGGGVQSTNYRWSNWRATSTSGTGAQGSNSDTSIQLADSIGNTANYLVNGRILIDNPQSALWKHVEYKFWWDEKDGQFFVGHGGGEWQGTAALTGFQFSVSSGTFTSGDVYAYGIRL